MEAQETIQFTAQEPKQSYFGEVYKSQEEPPEPEPPEPEPPEPEPLEEPLIRRRLPGYPTLEPPEPWPDPIPEPSSPDGNSP